MDNSISSLQMVFVWALLLIPIILFDIAAIRWGVYTSGSQGPKTSLEV